MTKTILLEKFGIPSRMPQALNELYDDKLFADIKRTLVKKPIVLKVERNGTTVLIAAAELLTLQLALNKTRNGKMEALIARQFKLGLNYKNDIVLRFGNLDIAKLNLSADTKTRKFLVTVETL